ncbi:13488_t:CDS:1, partial [Gigaspora margarita]
QLLPDRRAHEMPDKVNEWISFLNDLKKNFYMFFGQELLIALKSLDNENFGELFDNLERRINKAYEHFVKWMTPWMHLPLSICRFGGNSGYEFA